MNVKVEALDQHKVSVGIELPAEVVQKGFKKAVSRIANQVRIPGFRKGKANRKILEMHFGKEAIEAEAKDIVINEAVDAALRQEKLIPVTTPDVKEDKFSEAEGAAFTATFVKRPEVELGEYKGLEAEKASPEITDDQVMAQLKGAAEQNARLEKAEEGTELKKGDFAIIDFKGTVDGKPFEGGEGKTYPLEIGSQSFIPGFEEQLEGHKAGDDVTVKVVFPEDYFVDALKGKEAEFLQELAQSLHLSNRVRILGYRQDVCDLLHASDIFCFPSKREGLGMAALEAMEAGLPLVTSNIHGIRDYSLSGETGFACPVSNVEEFAHAIETLSENRNLRKRMGTYNQQAVEAFYQAKTDEIMKSVYTDVLKLDEILPETEPEPVESASSSRT